MAKTISRTCKNCTREFRTNKKNISNPKFEYCSVCRKHHKNCEVCGKEIFIQARTCSSKCAYELRKTSWRQSCGSDHNFSKDSSSRKKWEFELKKTEGISNVFQRESVKEQIKKTWISNYGVDNPSKSNLIKLRKSVTFDITRNKKYEAGIWIKLEDLSEFQRYRYNVTIITNRQLAKYGNLVDYRNKTKNNKDLDFRDMISIDHKFSVKEGFNNNISPEIIGSIVNLELMTVSKNSSKHSKCSISLSALVNEYKKFTENENKIDKEN